VTAGAAGDPLATLWTVALYSGCREGELLGLKWQDVDLNTGTLAIRRTLVGASGGTPRFGELKTARGRRTVTLPPVAVASLAQHRQRQLGQRSAQDSVYAEWDLVFATGLGTPLLARNVIRSFKAALGRAGLPAHVRVHDMRHAAATLMLEAGVYPKVASERFGHSNISITMDLYTHAVPGLGADAANRLERMITGKKDESKPIRTQMGAEATGDGPMITTEE